MISSGNCSIDLPQSYMGHTALGATETEKVTYSQVEIGGGRITGREVTPEHPQGIEFAMYHADQFSRPDGDYQKVFSADGAQWFKQYAVDTVANPVLFAYTCDMPRIQRFDTALELHEKVGTLFCFDFQEDAIRQVCGQRVNIQSLDFEKVKALLEDTEL